MEKVSLRGPDLPWSEEHKYVSHKAVIWKTTARWFGRKQGGVAGERLASLDEQKE